MSSEDKIDVLKLARATGFKNYLYYIATDDPDINIQRVDNRIHTGGHAVPVEKIRQRLVIFDMDATASPPGQ